MTAQRSKKTSSKDDAAGTFPKTLAAIREAQNLLWAVALALAVEISTDLRGRSLRGEHVRCHEWLAAQGFPEWSPTRIRAFHAVGRWVIASAKRTQFTSYPFERVRAAKDAANGDPEKALSILKEAKTKRDIVAAQTPEPTTDEGKPGLDVEAMAAELHETARARAHPEPANGERVVGQVREKRDEAVRVLEDFGRAARSAIEHEPHRRSDIEVLVRSLKERAAQLIAKAEREVSGTSEPQEQLRLDG